MPIEQSRDPQKIAQLLNCRDRTGRADAGDYRQRCAAQLNYLCATCWRVLGGRPRSVALSTPLFVRDDGERNKGWESNADQAEVRADPLMPRCLHGHAAV